MLTEFRLANPVRDEELGNRIGQREWQILKRQLVTNRYVELGEDRWQALTSGPQQHDQQARWPLVWPMLPGDHVDQTQLHEVFGGSAGKTANQSSRTPNTFLISGKVEPTVLHHGDGGQRLIIPGHPEWYSQLGEENLSILLHLRRGRPLRVFDVHNRIYRYLGEFVIDQTNPIAEWIDTGQHHIYKGLDGEDRQTPTQRPLLQLRPVGQIADISRPHGEGPMHESWELILRTRGSGSGTGPDLQVFGGLADTAVQQLRTLIDLASTSEAALDALTNLPETQLLASIIQRRQRLEAIAALEAAVGDPSSAEHVFQKILEANVWMFGEGYQPKSARRRLTALEEMDLSLIRPDGSLHGVELKRANPAGKLARIYRNQAIVGYPIHEAVSQVMNYLRSLDAQAHSIAHDLGIDCTRSSMTVVIGHHDFLPDDITSSEFHTALRTYNSHHARIQVITYGDLIQAAQRSIANDESI